MVKLSLHDLTRVLPFCEVMPGSQERSRVNQIVILSVQYLIIWVEGWVMGEKHRRMLCMF